MQASPSVFLFEPKHRLAHPEFFFHYLNRYFLDRGIQNLILFNSESRSTDCHQSFDEFVLASIRIKESQKTLYLFTRFEKEVAGVQVHSE